MTVACSIRMYFEWILVISRLLLEKISDDVSSDKIERAGQQCHHCIVWPLPPSLSPPEHSSDQHGCHGCALLLLQWRQQGDAGGDPHEAFNKEETQHTTANSSSKKLCNFSLLSQSVSCLRLLDFDFYVLLSYQATYEGLYPSDLCCWHDG